MPAELSLVSDPARRIQSRATAVLVMTREQSGPHTTARLLAAQRYSVHTAATIGEAECLLARHPDLGVVVLDLSGPGIRGMEIYTTLLQRLPPERELCVVFLAHSPSVNDAVRALRLGAVDLLRSPVDPAHLLDAVERAEAALIRRVIVRTQTRELVSLVGELGARAASLANATCSPVRILKEQVPGTVEFTEPLDAQAGREDPTSLAYNQRQRRRIGVAIKAQRLRRDIMGAALAGDPCWDMLLDLIDKSLMGRDVSVSSLCSVSAAPATTALRRLDDMVHAGLIMRVRDKQDARRVLVRLTDLGLQRLRSYFDTMGADG